MLLTNLRIAAALILLILLDFANAEEGQENAECLWIDNAKIVGGNVRADNFEAANYGHTIDHGKLVVIAVRKFTKGQIGPDAGRFWKTTIQLKKIEKPMKSGKNNLPVLASFHSEGSSAFVADGEYVRARDFLQSVRIDRNSAGSILYYHREFIGKYAATKKRVRLSLNAQCLLREVNVEDLSLWEGYAETNFRSFYPPVNNWNRSINSN